MDGMIGRRGALGALGQWPAFAQGQAPPPQVLRDTTFNLSINELAVNLTGARRTALAINGSLPGPLLRWREGDTVTLHTSADGATWIEEQTITIPNLSLELNVGLFLSSGTPGAEAGAAISSFSISTRNGSESP